MFGTIRRCVADGALQTIVRRYRLDLGSVNELRIQLMELLFDDTDLSKVIED
jgi:hypothetical protein